MERSLRRLQTGDDIKETDDTRLMDKNRPCLFIVAGATGSGKGTLRQKLEGMFLKTGESVALEGEE